MALINWIVGISINFLFDDIYFTYNKTDQKYFMFYWIVIVNRRKDVNNIFTVYSIDLRYNMSINY